MAAKDKKKKKAEKIIVQLVREASPTQEQKLLEKCCRRNGCVVVEPLGRLGVSGAKVLVAYPFRDKKGIPRVLKIHTGDKIEDEYEAMSSVTHLFSDVISLTASPRPEYVPTTGDRSKALGALVYLHPGTPQSATGTDKRKPQVFADIAYSSEFSSTRIREFIRRTYQHCKEAHTIIEDSRKLRLMRLYRNERDYLRMPDSQERIKAGLGNECGEDRITLYGHSMLNPLRALTRFNIKKSIRIGGIHGDLHCNNIVITVDGGPSLIDFAWARTRGPVLVDYVLLENSLRFVDFPHQMSLREQYGVDKALLKEDGYEEIHRNETRLGHHRRALRRMAVMIKEIRSAAKHVGAYKSFDDYLASQFLVLYGCMMYPTYDIHTGIQTLGIIATRLEKHRFFENS